MKFWYKSLTNWGRILFIHSMAKDSAICKGTANLDASVAPHVTHLAKTGLRLAKGTTGALAFVSCMDGQRLA